MDNKAKINLVKRLMRSFRVPKNVRDECFLLCMLKAVGEDYDEVEKNINKFLKQQQKKDWGR